MISINFTFVINNFYLILFAHLFFGSAPVDTGPSIGEFHDRDIDPSSLSDRFEAMNSKRPPMKRKATATAGTRTNSSPSHSSSDNVVSKCRSADSLSAKRNPRRALHERNPVKAFDRAAFRPHPNMTEEEMDAYINDRKKHYPLVGMHRIQYMITGPPDGAGTPGGGLYFLYMALGCGAVITFHILFNTNSLLETPQFPQFSTKASWEHYCGLPRYERLDFLRQCLSFSLLQPLLTEIVRYWACILMLGVFPTWFVMTVCGTVSYNWLRNRDGNIMRGNSEQECAMRSFFSIWYTHALIRYSTLAVPLGMHVAVNVADVILFFHNKLATYEAVENLLLADSNDM